MSIVRGEDQWLGKRPFALRLVRFFAHVKLVDDKHGFGYKWNKRDWWTHSHGFNLLAKYGMNSFLLMDCQSPTY